MADQKLSNSQEIFKPAYHETASCQFLRLPFVAAPTKKQREPLPKNSSWALPAPGGYGNGCEAGKIAARAYMKFLRVHGSGMSDLQMIVFDMAGRLTEVDKNSPEGVCLDGHIVGFCSELHRWLLFAARHGEGGLDKVSENDICDQLQDALSGGPERRWAERDAIERSQRAREAANTRWAKKRALDTIATAAAK